MKESLLEVVARIDERLEAQEKAAEVAEEHRRELMTHVIREAVQSAMEPLEARIQALEGHVKTVKTYATVATGAAAFAAWGIEHFFLKLFPALIVGAALSGCALLPKPPHVPTVEEACSEFGGDSKTFTKLEARACEEAMDAKAARAVKAAQ